MDVPIDRPTIKDLIERDQSHYCEGEEADVCVKVVAIADFPSRFGPRQPGHSPPMAGLDADATDNTHARAASRHFDWVMLVSPGC